jgi:hypothetical protein
VKVNLEQRVGLRVYIRVSGDIKPGLSIDDLRTTDHGPALLGNPVGSGALTLHYVVRNTGNVLLGATQSADISSWLGGAKHLKNLPIVPPLLPGAKVEITRTVRGVFPGLRVSATVHLNPVAPPGASDPAVHAVEESTATWAIPWLLLVLVLLVIAAVTSWLVWRRRRPTYAPQHGGPPERVLARSGGSK